MNRIKIIKQIITFVFDTKAGGPISEKLHKDWKEQISEKKIHIRGFSVPTEGENSGKTVFCVETIDPQFIEDYLEKNIQKLLEYESDLSRNLKAWKNSSNYPGA